MTVKPGSKEIVARSVGCTDSVSIVSQCKLVLFCCCTASIEQATDGAETAAIDRLVSSWSENISVSFCLQAPGYGLTLWCTISLLAGDAIQVPQLQLQLQCVADGYRSGGMSPWGPIWLGKRLVYFTRMFSVLSPGDVQWRGASKGLIQVSNGTQLQNSGRLVWLSQRVRERSVLGRPRTVLCGGWD